MYLDHNKHYQKLRIFHHKKILLVGASLFVFSLFPSESWAPPFGRGASHPNHPIDIYRGYSETAHTAAIRKLNEHSLLSNEYGERVLNNKSESRADSVLPKYTAELINKAKIYVEYDNGTINYHSNFKNIFLTSIATEVIASELAATPYDLHFYEEVLIDTTIFDENGIPRIDLTNVRNFRLVNTMKNYGMLPEAPEIITTSRPPPSVIAKIQGCCLYGRPPHLVSLLREKLVKLQFNKDDLKVASLFIDKATEVAIEKSSKVRSSRINGDSKALLSEQDLRKMFGHANGSTLVLLGHVEGEDYVIRTSGNVEQLRVSIEKVREIAKENNVALVDIGCETTKAIKEQQFGLGVMTEYNSVEAVLSLEAALSKSKSFVDFLENFSSENLKIVVEPSFVDRQPVRAAVYKRILDAGRTIWIKIAQISISFFT